MLLRSRLRFVVAVASLGLLVAPGAAGATKVIAPPGNSGVSQYVEVVPGAGGSVPVGSAGKHGPVLSPAARRRLEASGPSGKALVAFAQQTGVPAEHGKAGAGSGSGPGSSGSSHSPGSSHSASSSSKGAAKGAAQLPAAVPASAIRSGGPAGGGLGWGLYAALGAIVLAGAGFFLVRRRSA